MEERTDPRIVCSRRGGKVRKFTASPYSYDYKTIRIQQGTFCVKEPSASGTATDGVGTATHWYKTD